jgi:hypothetical protein
MMNAHDKTKAIEEFMEVNWMVKAVERLIWCWMQGRAGTAATSSSCIMWCCVVAT